MRLKDPHAQKIATLGRLCGIAPEYWDNLGYRHETSLGTYQTLLSAMGVPWEEPNQLEEEIRGRRRQPWERLVQPVTVINRPSDSGRLVIALGSATTGPPSNWQIQGEIQEGNGKRLTWESGTKGATVLATRPWGQGFKT